MEDPLDSLRNALLAMDPAGRDGFEGLCAMALSNICGLRFRLASSGYQKGLDGAADGAEITFEAKRYKERPPRADVLSKIPDFARDTRTLADRLWILCATAEVGTQLRDDIEHDADQQAISTLILDWPEDVLSPLASVLAAGGADIAKAIHKRAPQFDQAQIEQALAWVAVHADQPATLERIVVKLNVTAVATRNAVRANTEWRARTFASRDEAKHELGQPVAPIGEAQDRLDLLQTVRDAIATNPVVALAGGEGQGKSWLAASIAANHEGLVVFLTPDRFMNRTRGDLEALLVDTLIQQCGEASTEAAAKRWTHRLRAWTTTPPAVPPLVVVDGLNQRPDLPWHDLLDGLAHILAPLGGHLIVTCRPTSLDRIVRDMDMPTRRCSVDNWSAPERDAILKGRSVDPDALDSIALDSLRNPRLLGIALDTLPPDDPTAWQGLTRDRLLFEHINRTRRDGIEPDPPHEVARTLSHHASRVFDISAPPVLPLANQADDVRETRFFRPLPGPHGRYELREEGITLALGIALVDRVWTAVDSEEDAEETTHALIDPLEALDRTAEVLLAALTVCALDHERWNARIFKALLHAFGRTQNPCLGMFPGLMQILHAQPRPLFEVVEDLLLSRTPMPNRDWLLEATLHLADDPRTRAVAHDAARRWLSFYDMDGEGQIERMWGRDKDHGRHEKRVRDAVERIEARLAGLGPAEQDVLDRMTKVVGDIDTLACHAILIIAGGPVAPWIDALTEVNLATEFWHTKSDIVDAFLALAHHNRADPVEAAAAFRRAAAPLMGDGVGRAGRWIAVRLLLASGDEKSCARSRAIADDLTKDREPWRWPEKTGWRAVDPGDPEAMAPDDLSDVLDRLDGIHEGEILQAMGQGQADHFVGEVEPVLARFAPEALVAFYHRILSSFATRTDFPLRQLVINTRRMTPFMTPEIARAMVTRVKAEDPFASFETSERSFCHSLIAEKIVPPLPADEQLDAMLLNGQRGHINPNVIPQLRQPTAAHLRLRLSEALAEGDEAALISILQVALETKAQIEDDQIAELCRFIDTRDTFLLGTILRLAAVRGDAAIRKAFLSGDWEPSRRNESFYLDYGVTTLLLDAVERGEVTLDAALPRLPIENLSELAFSSALGAQDAALSIFDAAFKRAVNATAGLDPPGVEMTLTDHLHARGPMLSVRKREAVKALSLDDMFHQDMSPETFRKEQDEAHSTARQVFSESRAAGVDLRLLSIRPDLIRRLTASSPDMLVDWGDALLRANDATLSAHRNLALSIGAVLSASDPDKGAALLNRSTPLDGFIRIGIGAGLTLEHEAIWSAVGTQEIQTIWKRRLRGCRTDAELATEVLAADHFGAATFLDDFVRGGMRSDALIERLAAITITGLRRRPSPIPPTPERRRGPIETATRMAAIRTRSIDPSRAEPTGSQPRSDEGRMLLRLMANSADIDARVLLCSVDGSHPSLRDFANKMANKTHNDRAKTLFGAKIEAPEVIARSLRC